MSKIYVIDDQYLKSNYPSLNSYNNKDLLSVIMIEQRTSLKQTISAETYTELLTKIEAGEITGVWVDFLDLCQMYLMFRTVQGVFDLYEKNNREDSRDLNVANVWGKIKYAEKSLKGYIEDNDISTSAEYSSDYLSSSPIWYPR